MYNMNKNMPPMPITPPTPNVKRGKMKPRKMKSRQMEPLPMPDPSTIKNDSKPVFPKPPVKPVKMRPLGMSVDMGVQKGLKNFRVR